MSRVDQLIDLLGGLENLPQKPPPPPEEPHVPANEVDDEDVPPPIQRDPNLKPPSLLKPQIQPSKPAAAAPAMLSSDGEDDFLLDSRKGEPAPRGINFVPFIAVTKYCYKFVPKKWMQPLASAFFDADKIYTRDWDL